MRGSRWRLGLVALALACDSPTAIPPAGRWIGDLPQQFARWTIDITLTQSGDSLHGTGVVTTRPDVFNETYVASGAVLGDSITLRLRPVEDVDINVAGRVIGDRIVGKLWFNNNTSSLYDIVFERP